MATAQDSILRITVTCSLCGKVAIAAELVAPGAVHPKANSKELEDLVYHGWSNDGFLILEGVTGQVGHAVKADRFDGLADIIRQQDWIALYQINNEWAPSYCPQCDSHYCSAHWFQVIEFDDGFYDYTRGRCPSGHWRTLDD